MTGIDGNRIDADRGDHGSSIIPTLDGSLKSHPRIQAAIHGRSMEHEARDILRCVLNQQPQGPRNLGTAIHDLFRPFGGFDMPEVPRRFVGSPYWRLRDSARNS